MPGHENIIFCFKVLLKSYENIPHNLVTQSFIDLLSGSVKSNCNILLKLTTIILKALQATCGHLSGGDNTANRVTLKESNLFEKFLLLIQYQTNYRP